MKPVGIFRSLYQILEDPLRRNSLYLMATHGVISAFGFFFWKIAEDQYGTDAVGVATTMVSCVLLLHILARLGLDVGLIRFLPDETDKPGMINTGFTIVSLVSGAMAVVFILGVGLWAQSLTFVRDNVGYAVLFVAFTVVSSLAELLRQGVFVACRSTQSSLAIEIVAGVRLPLLLAFVSVGAFGIFISWGVAAVASLAVGVCLAVVFLRGYRPLPTIRGDVVGRMLRFSAGNYVAETLRELPGYVLPIIVIGVFTARLGLVEGKEMAAYFYIAWTIASAVMMISYATGSSLLAEGSLDRRGFGASSWRALRFMLLLLVVAIALVFLAGGWILTFFGGPYRENALWLLRLLSLSGVPIAITTIYVTYERMQRKVRPVILVYGLVAVFTIGVGYALLDSMELLGIGVAWLVSNSLAAIVACVLMTTGWQRARRKRRQGSASGITS